VHSDRIVVDAKSDRVLACHMLDPDAHEIIQGAAMAVKWGTAKKQFDQTVGIHPERGLAAEKDGCSSLLLCHCERSEAIPLFALRLTEIAASLRSSQ